MAEKKRTRRDLVAELKGTSPDIQTKEDQEFEFEEKLKRNAWEEEDSFRDAIVGTPLKDRLVECRNEILKLDYDGIYMTSICYSIRFDVGDGYSLDISTFTPYYDSSMGISVEVVTRILDTIIHLVPKMRKDVEIEVDNWSNYYDSESDLFKNRPPGHGYSMRGGPHELSRDIVGESGGIPISRIRYDSFLFDPVKPEFYSVKCGRIHVLFPKVPSMDDLEWFSDIKPILDSLSHLIPNLHPHFILWKDCADALVAKI